MALEHRETQHTLSSLSRVRLLYILQQDAAEHGIDELARAVELHPNTVREHLQILVDAGFVLTRTQHRSGRGRPRVLYAARTGDEDTVDPIAARTLHDALTRSEQLRRYLASGASGTASGTASAAQCEGKDPAAEVQLDVLEDYLDQSGFDAVVDRSRLVVEVLSCPMLAMVEDHRDLVCSVHFGIVQTMLRLPNGPLDVKSLEPFESPKRCRLQLGCGDAQHRRERPADEPRMIVEHGADNALIITGQ